MPFVAEVNTIRVQTPLLHSPFSSNNDGLQDVSAPTPEIPPPTFLSHREDPKKVGHLPARGAMHRDQQIQYKRPNVARKKDSNVFLTPLEETESPQMDKPHGFPTGGKVSASVESVDG